MFSDKSTIILIKPYAWEGWINKRLYTGISNNIIKRMDTHNAGKGAKYTRGRLPVYLETFHFVESKSEALKLEYKVKQMKKGDKIPYLEQLRDGGIINK